jgi:chaperonin cofactor prefoldin
MDEVLEMRISTLKRKLVETSKKINQIYEELNSNNH